MADYKMIGISKARIVERLVDRAPTESVMCRWARVRKVDFVARYFPSKKAWRLLDVRQAKTSDINTRQGLRAVFVGQVRGKRWYPNEDAAVMHAMALMGVAPEIT